jgi:hypothetical protein
VFVCTSKASKASGNKCRDTWCLESVSVCTFVLVKRVKRVKLVEISAAIPGAASVCVLVCASTAVVKQVQL